MTQPRLLLRLEGVAAAAAALALFVHDYHHPSWFWWLFPLLLLAPDLTLLGYADGTRVGAAFYNAAHSYLAPLALIVSGDLVHHGSAIAVGLIWVIHIGVDRALGYGLKYPTAFTDTHLGRV